MRALGYRNVIIEVDFVRVVISLCVTRNIMAVVTVVIDETVDDGVVGNMSLATVSERAGYVEHENRVKLVGDACGAVRAVC